MDMETWGERKRPYRYCEGKHFPISYPSRRNLDFYCKIVADLCRVCGNRAQTQREKGKEKQQSCLQYREEIEKFYGIIVQDEDKMKELVHCKESIILGEKWRTPSSMTPWKVQQEKWTNDGNTLSEQQGWKTVLCANSIRRGPKKKMQRGRPKAVVSDQPADASFADTTEASTSTERSTAKKTTLEGSPATECNVLPIMVSENDAGQPRPNTSSVRALMVSCATPPMLPPHRTLEDTLLKPVDLPPDKMEEQLHTSPTRRKLFAAGKQVILCKTRGQVSTCNKDIHWNSYLSYLYLRKEIPEIKKRKSTK